MGEMADYILEQIDYDCGYNGYEDADGWEQPTSNKTCRYCKRAGLHWELRDGKWRLCDNRGVHACKIKPLK